MKRSLIIAVLAAFSFPVMADSINLNSSRSNQVDANRVTGKPTKEQCAATKDAKMIAACKQFGIAVSDPGTPSDPKLKPTK